MRTVETHLLNLAVSYGHVLTTFDRRLREGLPARHRHHVNVLNGEGSHWRVTAPDGAESAFDAADDVDACTKHELFACAIAGCPDAFGWTFRDHETGRVIVPEEVRARIDSAVWKALARRH